MISCMAGSTQIALAMAAPLIIPLLLFGGFFLQNGAVPFYFEWMRYISWFMYGNEALSINQWSGVTFNDTICPRGVCTGEKILENFDFNPVSIRLILHDCQWVLFIFFFFFISELFLPWHWRIVRINCRFPPCSLLCPFEQDLPQKLNV